ncbi:hypothetical protein B296_00047505 [Ensete ventricosum]|uniref:Uncharacterized protein n=1 Tax=Ensete ventricosum TaxID=4639 RepID=A0A426XI90_ENSVE|nr:hypothetical protein B296_00047505 [Ensete ventricosum]
MPMNLKEGDRYVVNHGEDPTTVDFGDYVSLAEKEDGDIARRGDLARGRCSRIDRAEAVAGQRKRGDLDVRKRRSNDYNRRNRGCSISREGDSKGWKRGRWLRATVTTAMAGLRPRLGCGWKDLGEKDLAGLEGATRARPRPGRRDDAGSTGQRKGKCYRRTTKERSRHYRSSMEQQRGMRIERCQGDRRRSGVGSCPTWQQQVPARKRCPRRFSRPRRQRKDAGALGIGGCNSGRGDSGDHQRSNGASDFAEVFGRGVDDGGPAGVEI